MSWHYLQEQEGEFSEVCSQDLSQDVLLKLKNIQDEFCLLDKKTECSRGSQFGTTCEPSTENPGEVQLTLSLEVFHANRSHQQHTAGTTPRTYGPRCSGSSQKSSPVMSSPKTSQMPQLLKLKKIFQKSATGHAGLPYPRRTWVRTIFGEDIGYLATPTVAHNWDCHVNAKTSVLPEFSSSVWTSNPRESRVADGLANRMDRFKAIGNGQVPGVARLAWEILNH